MITDPLMPNQICVLYSKKCTKTQIIKKNIVMQQNDKLNKYKKESFIAVIRKLLLITSADI